MPLARPSAPVSQVSMSQMCEPSSPTNISLEPQLCCDWQTGPRPCGSDLDGMGQTQPGLPLGFSTYELWVLESVIST